MTNSALLDPTQSLFRIISKPAHSQELNRELEMRRRYYEIHDRLNFPSHFSESAKAANRAVWSKVLGKPVERARDLSFGDWRRLRDWAGRVERGEAKKPDAYVEFIRCEKAVSAFPELRSRLYR